MWDLIFCEGGVSLNFIDTLSIEHVQPNLSPKTHWAYPDLGASLNLDRDIEYWATLSQFYSKS
jgi:hypothetical protein